MNSSRGMSWSVQTLSSARACSLQRISAPLRLGSLQARMIHPSERVSSVRNYRMPHSSAYDGIFQAVNEDISATSKVHSISVRDLLPKFNPGLLRPLAVCCLTVALFSLLPSTALAAGKAAAVDAGTSGASSGLAAFAANALSFILHLDVHLGEIVAKYGATTYAILFSIIFAETGLVVTPFLPGDSLLFATGALAALGKLNLLALVAVYITAGTLGDALNYSIGKYFGTRALRSSLIKREYIERTERFYAEYGGKTIILARFVPIVRTFAPFIAGIGSMPYTRFGLYNVAGAILWTLVCVGAGFAFGNVPAVHDNFSLVVLGIILVSVLPLLYEVVTTAKGHAAAHRGRSGSAVRYGAGGSMIADFRSV